MQNFDPVETSSAILYELKRFEDLLQQIKERPGFTVLMTPGEQTSINEILKKTQQRISISKQFQETFL